MFPKKQFAKVGVIVSIIIIVGIIFIPNLRSSFMSGTKKYLKATGKVSSADTTTCGNTSTGKCQFRVNYKVDDNSYYSTFITRTDPQKSYSDNTTTVDIYYPEDVTYYTKDDDYHTKNYAKNEFEGQYKLSKPNKSVFILGIISLCLLIFSVFIYIF
tara:strand:+ start:1995 stop:2465 length:471 start_codon:yes stop_codon:yes gene_type:complete